MSNKIKQPTKFYSLFVPHYRWFQRLLTKKTKKQSLSNYLLDLVMQDLQTRGVLTEDEKAAYQVYRENKAKIDSRFTKKPVHSTFSLYIPNRAGSEWIRDKLDADFLCKLTETKSRSLYIWDLFVKDNMDSLKEAHVAEWEKTMAKKPKGKSPGKAA